MDQGAIEGVWISRLDVFLNNGGAKTPCETTFQKKIEERLKRCTQSACISQDRVVADEIARGRGAT